MATRGESVRHSKEPLIISRTLPSTGPPVSNPSEISGRTKLAKTLVGAKCLSSQLRKARGLTQETMAELLGVSQAEVSKMERRTELYVGTLRKFIEAMNGELVIAARFADGVEVPIRLAEDEDAA